MTNAYSEEYIKKHMGAEFVGQHSNFNMYKNDSIFLSTAKNVVKVYSGFQLRNMKKRALKKPKRLQK